MFFELKMIPRTIVQNKKRFQIKIYIKHDRQMALKKIKLLENSNNSQEAVLAQLRYYCCDNCQQWQYDGFLADCTSCRATYCQD